MAGTLGIATFAYLPFAFFNYINPLVAATYGFAGISIARVGAEGEQLVDGEPDSPARATHGI
jgi:NhaC family Na+:H+ antiporter